VRSVSSAFAIGLVLAGVGGLLVPRVTPAAWWQKRWTPLLGSGSWIATGLLGIVVASLLGNQRSLDQPWFSARNIDVTAPTWLRGSIDVGAVNMPAARLPSRSLPCFWSTGFCRRVCGASASAP
jgi:urea transport system permease protein